MAKAAVDKEAEFDRSLLLVMEEMSVCVLVSAEGNGGDKEK